LAADHAFLFKAGVKELAAARRPLATLTTKPNSEWAGNSAHMHFSGTPSRKARSSDPEDPESISRGVAAVRRLQSGHDGRADRGDGAESELVPALHAALVGTEQERQPRSLDEALVRWESSEVAADWLGEDFVAHHVTTERAELEA
jgi:glutamine synthetase